jgi:hypothetical protein
MAGLRRIFEFRSIPENERGQAMLALASAHLNFRDMEASGFDSFQGPSLSAPTMDILFDWEQNLRDPEEIETLRDYLARSAVAKFTRKKSAVPMIIVSGEEIVLEDGNRRVELREQAKEIADKIRKTGPFAHKMLLAAYWLQTVYPEREISRDSIKALLQQVLGDQFKASNLTTQFEKLAERTNEVLFYTDDTKKHVAFTKGGISEAISLLRK